MGEGNASAACEGEGKATKKVILLTPPPYPIRQNRVHLNYKDIKFSAGKYIKIMKVSLQLKQTQQLAMTPQLQQAIRLLQLSTLELRAEIQQAIESNPLLELLNENEEENESTECTQKEIDDKAVAEDTPVDTAWEDIYAATSKRNQTQDNYDYYAQMPQTITLTEHLLSQLRLCGLSEIDQLIGTMLIDSIDDQGYLQTPLIDVQQLLNQQYTVDIDEIETVLHHIQQFEPLGVGARNLQECLMLQLNTLPENLPYLDLAKLLVKNSLSQLGSKQYSLIQRKFKISKDELQHALTIIQHLTPKPGHAISANMTDYIIPDVIVSKQQGKWIVELNAETCPKLSINRYYSSLIHQDNNNQDANYLRNQLQEARWLLKSIESRNQTLLKVATCIVEEQRHFLEKGEEYMQPMVLNKIASAIDMHESTISRVTTQKYMHTPRGIFELKYFFSSHVATKTGGECSSTAIRALIKKMVTTEEPQCPLSDNQIATLLQEQGIHVARRTIAKYREALRIPTSGERKQLQ